MTEPNDKNTAIVVLPPVGGGRLNDPGLRTWLSRSNLSFARQPVELLERVLAQLGRSVPESGLAALRMWGQTGDRPNVWVAAADPVYLEPRLDHLCLHALRRKGVSRSDLDPLISHLQATLAPDSDFGFARVGSYGYVRARTPIATADVPAYVIDQQIPDDYLPDGDGSEEHRKLVSEIEMALHDHTVNLRRQQEGKPPVNSLWLWGGGYAAEARTETAPPLFSDDALLKGYWHSISGVVDEWGGDIRKCLDATDVGFVATTPEFADDPDVLASCLSDLRSALRSGRISKLVLLFRDGIRAEIRRMHGLRVWRGRNPVLEADAT